MADKIRSSLALAMILSLFIGAPGRTEPPIPVAQQGDHLLVTHNFQVRVSEHELVLVRTDGSATKPATRVSAQTRINIPSCPILEISEPVNSQSAAQQLQVWAQSMRRCSALSDPEHFVNNVLVAGSAHIVNTEPQPVSGNQNLSGKTSDTDTGASDALPIPSPETLNDADKRFMSLLGFSYNALEQQSGVQLNYKVRTRRIDTVVRDADGTIKLISGAATQLAPEPPALSNNQVALLNVCAPAQGQALTQADILPIERDAAAISAYCPKGLHTTLDKLSKGQGLKIVFWGDSITAGGFATNTRSFYVNQFLDGLGKLFPGNKFAYLNLGVSGTNTAWRLPSFEKDVLSKHPDLVIVEFVNDFILPSDTLAANYSSITSQAQAAGVELILCAPHLPSPAYMHLPCWHDVAESPYPTLIRELCLKKGIALADVARRWDQLEKEGLWTERLLSDRLLHPNNYGHKLYAQELLGCFSISAGR